MQQLRALVELSRLGTVSAAAESLGFSQSTVSHQLAALSREIEEGLAPVRGNNFIVFHDAYQYFEHRFGLRAAGAIALSDASPPGPARIAELRERVAALKVTCALTEPQFDLDLVQTVFEGHDLKTAVVDPAGSAIPLGPDMYPELIRSVGAALTSCN